LAQRDYEQIPVAHFAQQAEMSVGAFYERFPDKDAFLGSVVAIRFDEIRQRMEARLDLKQWQHQSAAAVSQAIVTEMMRNLHGYGAGVVRAALKQGHFDRTRLEPLRRYRAALADRAVALLAKHGDGKKPERAVRAAVQMAEATALDALLHDRGPLRLGSRRMAATLSAMMLSVLELTDEAVDMRDDDDVMIDMPTEELVAHEIAPVPVKARQRRRQAAAVPEPILIIPPPQHPAAPEKTEETPEPPKATTPAAVLDVRVVFAWRQSTPPGTWPREQLVNAYTADADNGVDMCIRWIAPELRPSAIN
jgi:AcrR family transcriptional regulator